MLEQTREIVRSFNHTYHRDVLVEPEILLPQNKASMRLPGTDGKEKMSKSLGNCIYLSDEPSVISKKFCRPEHFEQFLPEYRNLDELKDHYRRGGLGDVKVKKFLDAVLEDTLTPIREKRHDLEKNIDYIYEVLKAGTEKGKERAQQTLDEVKDAMKINYFDDKELILQQQKEFDKQRQEREALERRREASRRGNQKKTQEHA